MRPYVSVDIETTGIAKESHILQIAAVYDDLKSPIDKLKTLNMIIRYPVFKHCEPYALGMNAELLKKLMNKDVGLNVSYSTSTLLNFLEQCYAASNGCEETDEVSNYNRLKDLENSGNAHKLILAGKNVASFDIPKIRDHIHNNGNQFDLNNFDKIIHYKTLDVGSLYYDTFGDNVSLSKINKLTGRKDVSHDALDDALDVVYAIRYKLKVPHGGINE